MINTTSTNVNTEQNEKPKATPFLEQISLRDYFAAKAMQGLLGALDLQDSDAPSSVSEMSYMVADAMIKARSES